VPLRVQAFEAHKNSLLGRAEILYRAALREHPEDVDVLHMLGVVLVQRLRYHEALKFLWLAGEKSGWNKADILDEIELLMPRLRALTGQPRANQPPPLDAPDMASRGVAFVVMGMHRSGTSAMARVLNLCGAHLPARLLPPRLDDNVKGFWEPLEVVLLNQRILHALGGSWDQVTFDLPESGELIDEFVEDAQAVLDTEYGAREIVVIKDPRICVLAPLWHRALLAAGFRPVYIVTVRHPMEIARSLEARGDMSARQGLSLWHEYTKRILAFAETAPDVVFTTFDELLQDWRGLMASFCQRFDVGLDTVGNAPVVDAYLNPDLRRQHVSEELLADSDPEMTAIAELYQDCLNRCLHVDDEASRRSKSDPVQSALALIPAAAQASRGCVRPCIM
jgi:hypothetical protein